MIECPENEKGSLLAVLLIGAAVVLLGVILTVLRFKDLQERQVVALEKIVEGCQNGLPNSVPR